MYLPVKTNHQIPSYIASCYCCHITLATKIFCIINILICAIILYYIPALDIIVIPVALFFFAPFIAINKIKPNFMIPIFIYLISCILLIIGLMAFIVYVINHLTQNKYADQVLPLYANGIFVLSFLLIYNLAFLITSSKCYMYLKEKKKLQLISNEQKEFIC